MNESVIFNAALKLPKDQRSAFLDAACAGNPQLRSEVAGLLQEHDGAGNFMQRPAAQPPATDLFRPITEGPGTLVGPYKLLQQIGEGGFGVVYMAEQQEPVRRKVALKIIKPGMDTKEVIARFESERQALALMDHPNIARVLDAGATESGRPYFVMELVKGVPITDYCDKNNLPTEKRLELFITVCHAVQHAHQKGVIHRDLKPSNVMVTLHDGQPVPKVIDFGVAKATSQRLTERTLFTAYGQMVGTPAYMSPEQAEMSGLDIDTRSDTYSLGVLLYELLTGTTPFDGRRLRDAGYIEMQRIIREEEPPRPSTRVSTLGEKLTVVSTHRSTDPAKLRLLLRGDLDLIVMKAMEKERSRRYDTPNSFADDVLRFLNHEAILARPASTAYRLKKFIQRNKAAVVTATAIAATLLLGTIVSTGLAIHAVRQSSLANREREVAEAAKQEAERQRDAAEKAKNAEGQQRELALQQKQAAESARNAERELREEAENQRRLIEQKQDLIAGFVRQLQTASEEQRRTLYTAQMNLVANAWAGDNIPWMRDLLNSVRPQPGQEDLRGFEWHYWHRLANSDLHSQSLEPLRSGRPPAFSVDGSLLAEYVVAFPSTTNSNNPPTRGVRIWNTTSGQQVGLLNLPASNSVPQARIASSLTGVPTDDVELWLSPDGRRVAVSYPPGTPLTRTRGEPQTLTIQIFDIRDANPIVTIRETGIWDSSSKVVMFSGDGNRVAVQTSQHGQNGDPPRDVIKVWDTASGTQISAIAITATTEGARGTPLRISSLAINTDGSRVASFDGSSITIWNVASQEVVNRIASDRAIRLNFCPDGKKLVARVISGNGQEGFRRMQSDIKIWDIHTGAEMASFAVPGLIVSIAHSPDGKWLAFLPIFANAIRSVQLFSADTGKPGPQFKGHDGGVVAIAFSPDSSRLFTAADDGAIKQWDIAAALRGVAPNQIPISRFASPQGGLVSARTLLAVSSDGTTYATATRFPQSPQLASLEDAAALCRRIILRRTDDDAEVKTIEMGAPLTSLVSSREGGRFAAVGCAISGGLSNAARIGVWDAATGKPVMPALTLAALERPYATVRGPAIRPGFTIRIPPDIALSPDGKLLACSLLTGTASNPRTSLKIVEVDSQRVIALGDSLPGLITGWSFSPAGSRILGSVGLTGFSVFDARTAQKLWSHAALSQAVAFSTDGTQVYAHTTPVQAGGAMQIWDAATGQQLVQFSLPFDSRSSVKACLSPDGKQLATSMSQTFNIGARGAGIVEMWNVASRSVMFTLHGHTMPVVSIAFSPDGRRIVTSSGRTLGGSAGSGETMLWDAQTGQELMRLGEGTGNLTFTPDGRQLFGDNADPASSNTFQRWDALPLSPEREADLLLKAVFSRTNGQRLPLKSEALAQIDADKTLSQSVRLAAREQVRTFRRSADELNNSAWNIVRLPDQPQQDYERGLDYAAEGSQTDSTNLHIWNTIGVAHYRLQQYDAAIVAFNRSIELNAAPGGTHPEALVFLAMTNHQLGDKQQAEDFLRRGREAINKSAGSRVIECRNYLAEAESLLGVMPQHAAVAQAIAGWGESVDPLGDCQINASEGVLSIRVPGTMHNMHPSHRGTDAPRILQEVEGDFTIQVKVTCPIKPETPLADTNTTYHGAGLLVYHDDQHFLRTERNGFFRYTARSQLSSNAPTIEYWNRTIIAQRANWSGALPQLPGDSTWLRIQRLGDTMRIALSHDGQSWEDPHTIETSFPPRVRVGVLAINSSGDEFKADFSDLKLTQP
jgi:serine/threonine protein kinase/WD40 repeat protein/regulation of enolase protein 1 (concanavalin A-like superfamily)